MFWLYIASGAVSPGESKGAGVVRRIRCQAGAQPRRGRTVTGVPAGTAVGGTGSLSGARLECRGVTVRFGGLVALDDVDLVVPPATIVGLVGPNGAGKSTLFNVLSGLSHPSGGKVLLDGEDVTHARPQLRAARGLARTFQQPELFIGLTVREHLVLAYRVRHARARVWSDMFTMGSLRPAKEDERTNVNGLLELLGLGACGGPDPAWIAPGVGSAGGAGPGSRHLADGAALGRTLCWSGHLRDRAVRELSAQRHQRARHIRAARGARRRVGDAHVQHR